LAEEKSRFGIDYRVGELRSSASPYLAERVQESVQNGEAGCFLVPVPNRRTTGEQTAVISVKFVDKLWSFRSLCFMLYRPAYRARVLVLDSPHSFDCYIALLRDT
jgi:hypothetical protein